MKKFLALLLACGMLLSLAACGSSSSDDTDETEDTTEETEEVEETEEAEEEEEEEEEEEAEDEYLIFSYGTDANSTTFDPASDLQTNSGSMILHAVGETLWTVDEEGNVTLKLAESYEYTDEYLTITVQSGILFSNGDELDAEDVLATLKHSAETERTSSMYEALDLDNAEITDTYTLTIPMFSYDAALIDVLGNQSSMILDSEVITDDYDYGWLIGTGPYMLQGDGETDTSGWEESVSYTLVRNENYWGDEPYYDEIDIYFYSEESTRYADFQSGKLDAIYLTEATYVNNLGSGAVSGASLIQIEETSVYGFEMAFNSTSTGVFSDIYTRMAFAHALDVDTMVTSLGEGLYATASSLVGESSWAYLATGIYEYDPDAAAEYLAEAGYSTDNPLTVYVYAESTSWNSALFEAAQAYCATVGINLDLTGLADFATILPTLLAGEQDVSIGSASSGSGNDPANLLQQFGPSSDNTLIKMEDEDLVSIWNEAIASTDTDTRTDLYQEFIQTIYDNYYYIPVYVGTKNYGVLDEHTSFADAIDTSCTLDPTLLTD